MANSCSFRVIVKGRKNACYAFMGGQNCDYANVTFEEGTDENFELHFSGTCAWCVDMYCDEYSGKCPVKLPKDCEDAFEKFFEMEEKYTVKSRSAMFDVEVMCNSMCRECGDEEPAYYEHYKSGKPDIYDDEIPEELELGSMNQQFITLDSNY